MENIKKFNPNFEIEEWCFDELKRVEDIEYFRFYNESKYYKEHSVLVEKIVGTTHQSYIGRKWIDLPYHMKRFYDFYNVENFLNFADSEAFNRNGLGYVKYGGYYFTTGGNHRTCQAKFSNLKMLQTSVEEFFVDEKMLNIFRFLKSEGLYPKISEGGDGKYYRFCNWKIFINEEEYYFADFSAILKFVNEYTEHVPSLKNLFSRYFKKTKKLFHYTDEKDYSNLKLAILLHKTKDN